MNSSPEYCLFWLDRWWTCMSKSEWSGWMQAIGAILALGLAVTIPVVQTWVARRRAIRGYFETIAMDVRLAEHQADVYLRSKIMVPAYRVPLHGMQTALPTLLAEGKLSGADATALAQWYVDAKSFNYCLDLTQELKNAGGDWQREVNRIRLKAKHLVSGSRNSRFDAVVVVLRKHLPQSSLVRLDFPKDADDAEDGG